MKMFAIYTLAGFYVGIVCFLFGFVLGRFL